MLSETTVSTFMIAGITGAGLFLAIYTLFVPMSHKIFEERAKRLDKWIEKFESLRNKITAESNDKELGQLKLYKQRINETKILPWYLGTGVIISFLALMVSALVSTLWLFNPVNRTSENEFIILVSISIGFIVFIFISLFIVIEVYDSMKQDFEEIKQKRKDALEKGK